jgi:hypothetical protein
MGMLKNFIPSWSWSWVQDWYKCWYPWAVIYIYILDQHWCFQILWKHGYIFAKFSSNLFTRPLCLTFSLWHCGNSLEALEEAFECCHEIFLELISVSWFSETPCDCCNSIHGFGTSFHWMHQRKTWTFLSQFLLHWIIIHPFLTPKLNLLRSNNLHAKPEFFWFC